MKMGKYSLKYLLLNESKPNYTNATDSVSASGNEYEETEMNEFENLLVLLDSYDLDSVEQGIELCVALGFAEVVQHLVKRGASNGGFNSVTHVYSLELTKPFWEWFSKVFAAQAGDFSPNENIFKVKEYDPSRGTSVRRNIEIFAHDASESWSEYSEDRFEKEVKLPL